MDINVSKLAAPIAFKTGNENTIVNVKEDGSLVANRKTFSSSNIFRWMRLSSTKAANNTVRTEFLRSLGEAFGIEGATVGNDGKTRFTEAFMDNLEKLLGADFKRADFGLDKDGAVASGKPLTERRVTAIVTRALVVGKTPFDVAAYKAKVGEMMKMGLGAGLSEKQLGNLHTQVIRMNRALDFLANGGVDAFIEDNPNYVDEDEASENNGYYFVANTNENRDIPYFLVRDGARTPLKTKSALGEAIFAKYGDAHHGGVLFHVENVKATPYNHNSNGEGYVNFREAFKTYIHDALKAYVKLSVDMFYDTLGTKVGKELAEKVFACTSCIEGQTTELIQFQATKGLVESADGATPVNLAVADHDKTTDLLECLAREAQTLEQANGQDGESDLTWDDYRPVFVKNLVGLVRPVQIDANGPVETREVTETDIDALRDRLNEILCFE